MIAGLYYDVGKVGVAWKAHYLLNPSELHVSNRGVLYTVNEDLVYMDIATRSLLLIAPFVPLSDEEAQAIRYPDGQYIEENRSVANRETQLTPLLQYVDKWIWGVLEAL